MSTEMEDQPRLELKRPQANMPQPRSLPAVQNVRMLPAKRSVWPTLVTVIVGLLLIAVGAVGAYYFWGPGKSQATNSANSTQTKRAPGVPVIAKRSTRGDLPVYLDGVGTVQALNMVTIHTRVDGELVKVLFTEGQFVHKDDLIAEIDPRAYEVQLSQAQAQQAKDQAALDNSRRDYQRYETAKEAVPQQQLDTAASQVTQFEAAVKIDQSAIDNAKLQLTYTKITAPLSGRMGLRMIDVGNLVHASDPNGLAVITQVQPISVVFTLAQASLPQVQKAMKEQSKVPVLAYDTTITHLMATGAVSALDNQIDITSGTFKIKAIYDNDDLALFPNQFVNVRLLVDMRKNAVLVPAEAIQISPQSSFVDVIDDDNTVEQRNVTAGQTEAGQTEVTDGLDEGEMVATAGLDRLAPGSKVALQSAQTNRSGRRGASSQAGTQAGTDGSQPATQGARGGRGGRGRGAASRGSSPESAPAGSTDAGGGN